MTIAMNTQAGKIITLFSTASGSGKTIAAINIAAALRKDLFNVCLVDLDVQFNDVCRYLHKQADLSIYNYTEDTADLARVTNYITHSQNCFDILAAPNKLEESYNIAADNISDILEQLRYRYDYVIVDTTTGFGELTLAAIAQTDILLFLGIVDFIPTIKNMNIGLDTLKRIGFDSSKIKLVLNRESAKTDISIKDVEGLLGRKFFHTIPNDFEACLTSIKSGIPLVESSNSKPIVQSYNQLAKKLSNPDDNAERQGISKLFGKLW